MLKSMLKSRGFWSCVGVIVAALGDTFVGDKPADWTGAIFAVVAFVAVTFKRKVEGVPTSYAGK